MILLLSAVVAPLLLGFALVRLFAPSLGIFLRIGLAIGFGIGLASGCQFLGLLLGIPSLPLELLLFTALLVQQPKTVTREASKSPFTGFDWVMIAAFGIVAACALYSFVCMSLRDPHGQWDAWAIFNFRARYLATGDWRDGFSPILSYSHPDYPLLLPAFVARVWRATGGREVLAPVLTAALFASATTGVLIGALARWKGHQQALLAGIVLLGTPYFVRQSASQLADVPLAFFILAAIALLVSQDRSASDERGLGIIAGLAAGMAAWTKNEGVLALVVVFFVQAAAAWFARGRTMAIRRTAWMLAGSAPMLAMVLYFRNFIGIAPDHHVGGRPVAALAGLALDSSRWKALARFTLEHGYNFGGLLVSGSVALLVYVACLGLEGKDLQYGIRMTFSMLVMILAGYWLVIVIGPFDIEWQVATAMDRLLLQLWPAAVFLVFLAARPFASPAKRPDGAPPLRAGSGRPAGQHIANRK